MRAPWAVSLALCRGGIGLLCLVLPVLSGCASVLGPHGRGTARPSAADERLARRYFIDAKVRQAQADWLAAIVALRSAADFDPGSAVIYAELARCYRESGDPAQALRFARRAVDLDPSRTDLRRSMIQLLEHVESPASAVSEVEQLIQREPSNWRLYRHLAYLYLQSGHSERITPLFNRVLDRRDTPPEVRADIASVLARVGKQHQAERVYRQVLATNPQTEDAWLGLAEVLQARGQREEALSTYRRAGHQLPDSPMVFFYLARAVTTAEDLDRIVVDEDPRFLYRLGVALASAGRQEPAGRVFRAIVDRQPSSAEEWLDLARYYLSQEDLGQASEVMTRAFSAAPDSAQLYLFWGAALEQADRLDEAIEVYRRGTERLPDEARLYLYWGLALEERQQWQEAADLYQQGLERGRTPDSDLHVRWGICLARQEQWDEATAHFGRALAMSPRSPEAHLQWGLVLERQGRWQDAVGRLVTAGELAPSDTRVLFYLGAGFEQASRQLGKDEYFGRAVATFRRLLELNPDDAYTLNYLGYMFAEKGTDLEEAVSLLQRAIELEPGNSAFYDSLGWAYFRLGEYQRAEEYLAQALAAIDDDDAQEQAVIFDHAGDVAHALGKGDEARRHWTRALELGPTSDSVRRKLTP
jgi:tetratricopeptide (TPR) repeat protein